MTIMFVENNGRSDYNGFNDGKLNYNKWVAGIDKVITTVPLLYIKMYTVLVKISKNSHAILCSTIVHTMKLKMGGSLVGEFSDILRETILNLVMKTGLR